MLQSLIYIAENALQIESIAKKLEADREELKRCLAEIDSLKVTEVLCLLD